MAFGRATGQARLFEIAGLPGVNIGFFYVDTPIEERPQPQPAPAALCREPAAPRGWAVSPRAANCGGAGWNDAAARFCAIELACAVETIRAYAKVVDPQVRGTVIEALKTVVADNRPDAGARPA